MTTPTTRATPPAASTRVGRGRADLPNEPGLDDLLADTRLSATAKIIAVTLVKTWAWYKSV